MKERLTEIGVVYFSEGIGRLYEDKERRTRYVEFPNGELKRLEEAKSLIWKYKIGRVVLDGDYKPDIFC